MFIDEVKIKVISGRGWDGLVSWRREKYIPKGGPWGGDGGTGWSVYLCTDVNLNTLSEYRHKKVLRAINGERGGTNTCHGANAEDLLLKVPVGTIVKDTETGEVLSDLSQQNMKLLVAKWGKGWFGNAHFCSSVRQAPAFAELGDVVEERDLHLELKLVADIGIIWVPSAWKSTLIWNVTNVKPKIGDYPFTTLTPNLGVLDYKGKSLVLEDVPGLIPGASEWKGLGIEFLKHIERTGVLLHLLDMYRMDQVFSDYENIRKELELFSELLGEKEEIIVFSKADLLDDEMREFILSEFKSKYPNKKAFVISAASGQWIEELKDFLIDNYSRESILEDTEEKVSELKVYDLRKNIDPKHVDITYLGDLRFEAKGLRIEEIVRMSDFTNIEAVMRVYNVLEKMGIMKRLEELLKKVLNEEEMNTDFFFEGSEDKEIQPKVVIAGKAVPLDRLKYNL